MPRLRPALSLLVTLSVFVGRLSASPTQTILHNFSPPPVGNGTESSLAFDSAGNLYGTSYNGGANNLGVVFKLSPTGLESVVHNFAGGADGSYPSSGVAIDAAGNLYGATSNGGSNGFGVAYKLSPTGAETILHSFAGGSDGANPSGAVVLDAAGNVFGTTSEGGSAEGAFDAGVVYKLDPSGNETILHSFAAGTDGANPIAGLTIDSQGNLYGTTVGGGSLFSGVVFKVTAAGKETVLYTFTGGADGSYAAAPLTLANGNLYGTTESGGSGHGVIFTLNSSLKQTVLYTFTGGSDGGSPSSGVVFDKKGNLYGTTPEGGPGGFGVVYTLAPAGQETVLYGFSASASVQGQNSDGGVIFGVNGHLFGATLAGGPAGTGVIYEVSGVGEETVLYSFPGSPGGFSPEGMLVRDQSGNLYGTNFDGGIGFGLIYKINPNGQETVLHAFTGGLDGGVPLAGLTPDSAGNLYGTTLFGGASNAGVVYKLTPTGNLTTLYSFTGKTDGGEPDSAVTLDADGNVYGTATDGGASSLGVVYKVSPAGVETVLHSFTGGTDGQYPESAVTRDPAGNLYGATLGGGLDNFGTVYRVAPSGQETILYNFTGGADGGQPLGSLLLDSAGNLYGTTAFGGANFAGVVFKLSGTSETVLFSFDFTDGSSPGTLVRDPAGNLLGTTQLGGTGGDGVVFEITPTGAEVVLHNFSGADGNAPTGVILDSSGALYGSTFQGGQTGGGVVYELK